MEITATILGIIRDAAIIFAVVAYSVWGPSRP